MPIWYALILVVIGDILLRKSRFFRQNYYIGGSEKSARLSGIAVDRMKILNYVIVGLLAGFAGVIMTARMGTASVTQGTGLELQVITAVIIGGASLNGGIGKVKGTFIGIIFLGVLLNGMTLMNVNEYAQYIVRGGLILGAVLT